MDLGADDVAVVEDDVLRLFRLGDDVVGSLGLSLLCILALLLLL